MPRKHTKKNRRCSRRQRRTRVSRRSARPQRGGGHKEDLIELITAADNFPEILAFFQTFELGMWHPSFPKKDNDDYILLLVEGEATEDDSKPQKIIFIKMKKLADHFAEVTLEKHEQKATKDFKDQYPADLLEQGAIYSGIRDAIIELFGTGR